MKPRKRRKFVFATFVFSVSALLGQNPPGDPLDTMPNRGFYPLGSYGLNGIEAVNNVTGNVTLGIPLAKLPPGPGGSSLGVTLYYNSAIFDQKLSLSNGALKQEYIPSYTGGWRYGFEYGLGWDIKQLSTCPDPYYHYKAFITMPDGSRRNLRLQQRSDSGATTTYSDNNGDAYYPISPFGNTVAANCSQSAPAAVTSATKLVYVTVDSSYIRVEVAPTAQTWTIFLPDGAKIDGSGAQNNQFPNYPQYTSYPLFIGFTETITDRNGNRIYITPSCTNSGPCTTTITDDFTATFSTRKIVITYGATTDTITWPGAPQVQGTTVAQTTLSVDITHGTLTLPSQIYSCGSSLTCNTSQITLTTVQSILLPAATSGGTRLSYALDYACAGCTSTWGELHKMTTPSGAFVNYSYFRDSQASTTRPTGSLINQVRQKTVQYTPVSSDLSAYKLITTFAFNYSTNVTTVTAPDNGHTQYWFNGSSSPALSGLIYEVDYPDDSSLSYTWQQNAPFNAPVNTQANPYVQYQSRKTPDGKISAVSNTVDKNGNLREVDDFDWIATGTALTVSNALRKTTATYYAATYDNDPAATATDNTNAYWSTTAPTYLGAVKSRTVADINSDAVKSSLITSGTVVAARAYTYDNALTTANVQSFLEWDSARGAYGDGTLTVCATGSTGCTTNAIRTSWTYASNGNVLTATDANGNLTQLNYDANNLYPTQVSVGGLRTAAYSFDGASGYLESSSDTDNAITTTYAYDLIGRQIKIEQAATGLDRVTTTSFDDANLLVTTAQDRAATNDQLLVTKAYYDPLGRLRLSVDAAGNNVQTAYFYSTCDFCGIAYQITSNPYVTTSDSTMGWTLTTKSYASHSDQRSIQYFSGSSAPVSFDGTNTTVGGNSTTSGTASSLYSGFTATMTDEAGVAHSYQLDGLGRVTGADGSTYKYDALDNLIAAGSRTFAYSSLSRPTQAINLESGTTAYLFDNNGNLVAYTDGRGISRCIGTWIPASGPTSAHCDSSLGYDALNRPLKKTYSDSTPATTYVYDQDTKGTLSSVTTKDATGTVLTSTTYTHDAFGRIKGNTQTTIGQAYNPFVYSYNLADFPTSVTYPSGRVINYTPDSYNRVAGVGDASKPSNPYAQILLYAADNSITQMNLGNGLTEAVALNPRLQASVISVCSTGTCTDPMNAANLLNLQLVYTQSGSTNNNGNIWSQTITAPNLSVAQSYTYDAANYKNQLATAGEATWSQTYGYNSGNRWVSATSGYNAWPPGFSSSTSSFTPTAATNFDSNNRLNPSAGNAYDTAGNQTAIGAYQITFDAEGRLASSTISSRRTQYTYDGEGKRVMKLVCPNANPCTTTTTDVTQTNYVFDADGELAAEYTTPAPSTQTCTIGTCYLTADHLGSTRLVTDSLGNPLARYDYLPDGQEIPADGTTRTTAMMYQTNQDGFNPKFTGQTFDLETLMYFMNARYYSPPQGRFISPDPDNAGADLSDPLTFNGYAYAGNNPLAFVDPLGLGQDPVASGTLCYPDPSCGTGSGTSGSSGSANFWWSISYGGFGPFGGFGPDPLRFYGAGPTSRGAPVDDYVDQGDGPINPLKGTVLSWWVDGDSVALAARNLRESETLEGTIKSGMALALIVAISVPPGGSKAARGTVAVYQIVDRATADVLYVGITSRIPQRIAEHAVRFFGADLKVVLPNLTRTQARAVEQVLIEHYGRWWFGGRGTLYNMYNSIRPGSRLYQEVVPWGRALARSRGLIP